MESLPKANYLEGPFFDPLFLGELKHINFHEVPWRSARFAKLLFGEEKKILRNAFIKLARLDYEMHKSD